jgi:hypothetical protein
MKVKHWRELTTLLVLALILQGCAVVGPASLSNGRSAYNEVINATEDQQILSMIVRQRYDETFGMLAVSSVTASLRIGATIGANAGIGPSSSFEGNLVPLSAGAMYEENPTISYVPMRGEQFLERMLAPVSAEQALLLSRMSTDEVEVLRMLVRRANGMVNPQFSSQSSTGENDAFESAGKFDRFIVLYVQLRERGRLDVVQAADQQYQLLLHDYTEDESRAVGELLELLGVHAVREGNAPVVLPLRFFVGNPRPDAIDFETPSALEIIEAASSGVEVPDVHLADGVARPPPTGAIASARPAFIAIHSSRERPAHASAAVMHNGWWFYVDARDHRSKQAFTILRTLIGLRLDDGASGQAVPVLTVPVVR